MTRILNLLLQEHGPSYIRSLQSELIVGLAEQKKNDADNGFAEGTTALITKCLTCTDANEKKQLLEKIDALQTQKELKGQQEQEITLLAAASTTDGLAGVSQPPTFEVVIDLPMEEPVEHMNVKKWRWATLWRRVLPNKEKNGAKDQLEGKGEHSRNQKATQH